VISQHGKLHAGRKVRSWTCFLAVSFLCGTSGCTWDQLHLFTPPPAPPPPAESLTLRGDRLEIERVPPAEKDAKAAADLAGALDYYRLGEFKKCEQICHHIADNTKVSPQICEEARFYEAECLRQQHRLPRAADTYNRMLNDFPSGAYREQAVSRMFEIANFWLDDTRKVMAERREQIDGQRTVIWPEWFHFENDKPFMDEEGRAIEKLEQVRYNDMTGPLADKALFLSGSVKFFRQDYKEADHYYSQIVEMHKNSPFAPQALELAIISKQLSTGGPDYDARKLAEARKLIDVALRSYPELAQRKEDFLERQIASITLQQAAKDYKTAEFYRRTGHPCSAYFCYQVVRMRYPGTKYYDLATQRMHDLRGKLEKEKQIAEADIPPERRDMTPTAPLPDKMPATEMSPPRQLPPGLGDR
jgi:outer membrane protein assembly factor BamD (BamD/ComL family)